MLFLRAYNKGPFLDLLLCGIYLISREFTFYFSPVKQKCFTEESTLGAVQEESKVDAIV